MDQRVAHLMNALDAIDGLVDVGDQPIAILHERHGHDIAAPQHGCDVADLRLVGERAGYLLQVRAVFDIDPKQRDQWLGQPVDIGDSGDADDFFFEQAFQSGSDGAFGYCEFACDGAVTDTCVLREAVDYLAVEIVEFKAFHRVGCTVWEDGGSGFKVRPCESGLLQERYPAPLELEHVECQAGIEPADAGYLRQFL